MISSESRTQKWINKVAKENNAPDLGLVEKTIRAFCLLESLAKSACPFIFKGGSSLMLWFNTSKRLSIDVDIICPPGTEIKDYLEQYASDYGFHKVEIEERISRTNVPKTHAKYLYQVSYVSKERIERILLDVLYEDSAYQNIVQVPIASPFLSTDDEPIMVNVPSMEDLLGDKLSAFAPHTTGIPYFKGTKNCSVEIIKQLFDISCLFERIESLDVAANTYKSIVPVELGYRKLNSTPLSNVLKDTLSTCLCISTRGASNKDEFEMLQDGISRIKSFIHSEKYNLESSIRDASRAAYLSACILSGTMSPVHYQGQDVSSLALPSSLNPKLKKLQIAIPEAYYYWCKAGEIL